MQGRDDVREHILLRFSGKNNAELRAIRTHLNPLGHCAIGRRRIQRQELFEQSAVQLGILKPCLGSNFQTSKLLLYDCEESANGECYARIPWNDPVTQELLSGAVRLRRE